MKRSLYIINMLKTMSISIDSATITTQDVPKGYDDFDKSDSFRNKVFEVIKRENKFVHAREVAKILHILDPKITERDYVKKVSPTLSLLQRKEAITKIKVGKSNSNCFFFIAILSLVFLYRESSLFAD